MRILQLERCQREGRLVNMFGDVQIPHIAAWYVGLALDEPITSDVVNQIESCLPVRQKGLLRKRSVRYGRLYSVHESGLMIYFDTPGAAGEALMEEFILNLQQKAADSQQASRQLGRDLRSALEEANGALKRTLAKGEELARERQQHKPS